MPPIQQQTPTQQTPPPQPAAKHTKKRPSKAAVISISIITAILIALGIGAGIQYLSQQQQSPAASTSRSSLEATTDGNATITDEESTIANVAEKVSPSVVSIMTETQSRSFYGPTTSAGAGTGVIISEDGYVMTNNHVVESVANIAVVDNNGQQYTDVEFIGRDPLNDIAFLKITSDTKFKPATLGNSSTIRIGQQVIAIGNALGQYSHSVTSGIVSGVGRPIQAAASDGTTESLTDLIQTDASINPGNSGGPLVNAAGQVIGINTAIVEDANGIGFAIPINSTKGVLAGVLQTGKVSRSYLGINFIPITPAVANQYKLDRKEGAYVFAEGRSAIASGSPASKSDLRQGDIITKINDESLGKQGSLSSVIGQYRPNDTVTVTYVRDGQERTTTITLGEYSS